MKRLELQEIINSAVEKALKACDEDNPVAAWSLFISALDYAGRRIIGDRLEEQGKNRYTGESQFDTPKPPPKECACDNCWCDSCAELENCVVDIPGYNPEDKPCPCDGCVSRPDAIVYAPRSVPPPCGKYRVREEGADDNASEAGAGI